MQELSNRLLQCLCFYEESFLYQAKPPDNFDIGFEFSM